MTMTSLRSPILFAAVLALTAAAPGVAQISDDERADHLYEEANIFLERGDAAQARDRFTQSCDLGHQGGCLEAGPMWARGDGGQADTAIAIRMYRGMCTISNNRAGCLAAELGETHGSAPASAVSAAIGEGLYAEGQRLMAAESTEGLNFLGAACQINHAPACLMYGRSLDPISVFDSEGFEAACRGAIICTVQPAEFYSVQDDPEAGWALTRACDLGSGEGCLELGDLLNPTGLFGAPSTPENWRGAISAFQRACDEHQLADGCERYRRLMENRRNPETAAVLAYRDARCAEGDQPSCEIVAAARNSTQSSAQAAPTLAPLDCAVALYLVSTDGPQHAARATAEARAAVQAHIAANGGDQLQLENQVVAAARTRLQGLQAGAETPDAVRRDVQACRRQFGFQP
jgi:TPR repeat protein